MSDLELRAEFGDHLVVEIRAVICDNPFGSAIPTDKIMFNESSHNILGIRCERGCFYPLGEIINCHKDETMSVGSGGFDFSDHEMPHIAKGQGAVRTFSGTGTFSKTSYR